MTKEEFIQQAPFGYCPICGTPFAWDSDGTMADRTGDEEDDDVPIIFCHCPECGASSEIIGCTHDEMKDYPHWNKQQKAEKSKTMSAVKESEQYKQLLKDYDNLEGRVSWDEEEDEVEESPSAKRWCCLSISIIYGLCAYFLIYGVVKFIKHFFL